MKKFVTTSVLSGVLLTLLGACAGPTTFTRNRMVFEPYDPAELRQEKDGITAEIQLAEQLPVSFRANVEQCDSGGRVIRDQRGPLMETISLRRPGQVWHQVAITNYTKHVVRTNGVVLRLFDPGGTQYESLTRDDLVAQIYAERPCASMLPVVTIYRAHKLFDRNMEFVPGTTSTFWMAFRPATLSMTGVWKFSIYEVPVAMDSAGRPSKTTQFDMRVVAKQLTETLTRDSPYGPARIVSSSESSPLTSTSLAPSSTAPGTPSSSQDVRPEPPQTSASSSAPQPLTKEMIIRAQTRLKELGFDPGTADGMTGGRTARATRDFQGARGLLRTGTIDTPTLRALGIN